MKISENPSAKMLSDDELNMVVGGQNDGNEQYINSPSPDQLVGKLRPDLDKEAE